jgi:hypothetical protein
VIAASPSILSACRVWVIRVVLAAHAGHFRSTTDSRHTEALATMRNRDRRLTEALHVWHEIVYNAYCDTTTAHRAAGGCTRRLMI